MALGAGLWWGSGAVSEPSGRVWAVGGRPTTKSALTVASSSRWSAPLSWPGSGSRLRLPEDLVDFSGDHVRTGLTRLVPAENEDGWTVGIGLADLQLVAADPPLRGVGQLGHLDASDAD